jgi:hypothetical protein
MLHRSAHFLSPHRHLFWHAPWSKCNYLPLSDNHIPAKVDHLSYDATIWVLHWSFTINPPSTHSSSSHTFTALQLPYTRTSLPSIQHQLLATSCQSGTDLQLMARTPIMADPHYCISWWSERHHWLAAMVGKSSKNLVSFCSVAPVRSMVATIRVQAPTTV